MAKFIRLQNESNHDVFVNIETVSEVEISENGEYIVEINFFNRLSKYKTMDKHSIEKLNEYLNINTL